MLAAFVMATSSPSVAETTNHFASETPAAKAKRLEWLTEARFGMFIHWGVYSVPAGEWQGKPSDGIAEWIMEKAKIPVSEYEKFAPQFNPTNFNAKEWVSLAKNAGMKYIVITTKHHDGFAMWPSVVSDWGIKAAPFQRDPLKELAAECSKQGVRLCFYHSIMDWHHPDWPERRAWHDTAKGEPDMDRYVAYMKSQIKELLTNYGPIGILWFDGEWEKPWTHERGVDLYNYVRGLQPDIIINNRVGNARAGMTGMDKGDGVGDYGTPEQEIPATGFGPGVIWESCMTMNDTWGFRKGDHNWKSAQTLVRNLIDCASKGGNYLLNVGPKSDGEFPAASVERLQGIGAWMKVNGRSIHGASPSPFKQQFAWGRCTHRGNELFLHVFDWPKDGKLRLPVADKKAKAKLLANPKTDIKCFVEGNELVIELPAAPVDQIATVISVKVGNLVLK